MIAGSKLEKVIRSGQFAVTGELGPPKSADLTMLKQHGEALRNHVEAFNITDNQTAIVRTSSIACGAVLVQMGLEPIIQITVRDRNRIGIQGDVLGAVALGIKNILCLSGDHQKFGNEQQAKGVYDIDSMQLLDGLRKLRDEGRFIGGDKVGAPVSYYLGAVANPFADPFEYRVDRLEKRLPLVPVLSRPSVFLTWPGLKNGWSLSGAGAAQKVAIMEEPRSILGRPVI